MPPYFWIVIPFLCIASATSVWLKKLTPAGGMAAAFTGGAVYAGAGFAGLGILATFFLLGTGATGWQRRLKAEFEKPAPAEKRGRTAGQVIANGGVAAVLGLLSCFYPQQASLYTLMLAASVSAATADTLSSELGTVYGRRFYHILTFKKDQRGLDGVISREGTLLGIAGSALIALLYGFTIQPGIAVVWIIVAGTVGNIADSVLGATLERRHVLSNNFVNFLNTLIAACCAMLCSI